eukprot:5975001-Amphidinium_carterae.2
MLAKCSFGPGGHVWQDRSSSFVPCANKANFSEMGSVLGRHMLVLLRPSSPNLRLNVVWVTLLTSGML